MINIPRLQKHLKKVGYKIILALGEFEIKSNPLGQGGNGIVFEGTINDKSVAIKFLVTDYTGNTQEQKKKRFISEYINIIAIENLSSVVNYIDFDIYTINDEEGELIIPLIIMLRYESSLLKVKDRDVDTFISLYKFLINTVGLIHKEGIIHRDIKPENILVKGNKFYLADFGIASYNPEMFKIRAETEKKERLGNRLYSAPEQEEAAIEAHSTMDIYAIGQVLQWYVTGKTHRGTGRVRITSVFPELDIYDNIIEKCLAQDPNRRFQNVDEIEEYIRRTKKKDIFQYLYLFHDTCVSSFPRNDSGILHCNDKNKIDRLLFNFKSKESEFDNQLWWVDGDGSYTFKLAPKGIGTWKFSDREYNITDIWVHYDSGTINDFVLFKFQKGQPFIFENKEVYYASIVDDIHHISHSEYINGYAEIEGEVKDLANHKVEFIDRQDEEGYFVIGTEHTCVILWQNEEEIRDFKFRLLNEQRLPTIEEVMEFQRKVRKHKSEEVRASL